MKSLIMKDLYNVSHNAKSMLLVLAILAITVLANGAAGYQYMGVMICSMMIITTFHFDEHCSWNRYALVMPVSKKDIITAKYVALYVFVLVGAAASLLIGLIAGVASDQLVLTADAVAELVWNSGLAMAMMSVIMGTNIPLVVKFGTEKGRMMTLVAVAIPTAIGFLIYIVIRTIGVPVMMFMDESLQWILLAGALVVSLVWNFLACQVSCRIFEKKEF